MYPINLSNSWTILSKKSALKVIDSSLIKDKSTITPKEIIDFIFNENYNIEIGEKIKIKIGTKNGGLYFVILFRKDESKYILKFNNLKKEIDLTKLKVQEQAIKLTKNGELFIIEIISYDNFPILDELHKDKLKWADKEAGNIVEWKLLNDKSRMICSTAKGIYKPKNTDFALSVKEVLGSQYNDKKPIDNIDGSWVYDYHQEGDNIKEQDNNPQNIGIINCMNKKIPIIVCIQKSRKPDPTKYLIKGIGLVTKWEDGFFRIESTSYNKCFKNRQVFENEKLVEVFTQYLDDYDPKSEKDGREKTLREISIRRGQDKFRKILLSAYNNQCSITGCSVLSVLEAAHITKYNGINSNTVTNGLLLRADIHTLWDLGLIAINEYNYTVTIHNELKKTEYYYLDGKEINLPDNKKDYPSLNCLKYHKNTFSYD